MRDFLAGHLSDLLGRASGPFKIRLILQPAVAALLAIREGLKDLRGGYAPHLEAILSDPAQREYHLRSAARSVGRVFLVAILVDVVYQILEFHWFYPLQTLVLASTLALVPYVLICGPINRLLRRSHHEAP